MDIIALIDNQDKLNAMTLRELRNTVERFPFYHTARLLYVINLYKLHENNLSEELTKASLLIPNRQALFNVIEGKNYDFENNKQDKAIIDTDENRTVSLIDEFLSKLPQNNDKTKPHKVPTVAELTNDYASFLQMKDEHVPAEEDNMMEADEQDSIIDSFIKENKGKQRYELNDSDEEPIGPINDDYSDSDDVFNENIVNIYIKQGRYQQALEILKTICLNNPEKNTNFASQLRLLETIVNNKQ